MKHGDQRKLAKAVGITDAHACLILNGKRRPSWDLAKKLASLTGTEPSLWMDAPSDVLKKAMEFFNG